MVRNWTAPDQEQGLLTAKQALEKMGICVKPPFLKELKRKGVFSIYIPSLQIPEILVTLKIPDVI